MNRRITRLSLIQGLLIISLVPALFPPASSSPSLGTSQHNPQVTIVAGQSRKFSVGRIYNTGDAALNIVAGWHQEFGSKVLSATVTPGNRNVQPGESYVIYLTVYATKVGFHNGTVQFAGETLTTEQGNPIRPSGSLPAQITIIGKPVEPTQPQSEVSWLLYVYACIGVGLAVALMTYLIRFRKSVKRMGDVVTALVTLFCPHVCSGLSHTKGKNGTLGLGHWVSEACIPRRLH